MTTKKHALLWAFLLATSLPAFSQSKIDKQTARQFLEEAIRLEDKEGKYDEALKLLEQAQKLDPENTTYLHEIAYTYGKKNDHKKSAEILEGIIDRKGVGPETFQALGNSYDFIGQPDKAIATYQRGLKKHPNSGSLYLELGNMKMQKEKYLEALELYEEGIKVDPKFPSNYYWAAKIFCSSNEEVWGMIYGEIFMNLERNSKRTAEISKLLYKVYKSQIQFTSDTSRSISFSQYNLINADDLKKGKKSLLPFGVGVYEPLLLLGVVTEDSIDINSLDRIRTSFVVNYYQKGNDKNFPNVLFDYQNKLLKAGHLEAYNHYILMMGDEEGYKKWYEANKKKWSSFADWANKTGWS